MPSSSLSDVRPSWIAFGWFLGAAITALILLALVALELVVGDPSAGGVWTAGALAVGFGLAGYIVGWRVAAAPLVHGLGMGLFSLLVWLVVNLLGEPSDQTAWSAIGPAAAAALLLLQAAAAVVGARIGVRNAGRR